MRRWQVLLFLWCVVVSGCALVSFRGMSLEKPMVLQPLREPSLLTNSVICLEPFASDVAPPRLGRMTAAAYARAIEGKGFGVEVRYFDGEVRGWGGRARREECHLFLQGKIERAVITGGGQPQGMRVLVRVVEMATGGVIFSALQEGFSSPGKDADWYWSSSVGRPARSIEEIAEMMAAQLAALLSREREKALKTMDIRTEQ